MLTGHADGLITLNVEEADDVKREKIRHDLHEPYRTLLGHFRHEVGHYYWDRLVRDSRWLAPFRELFGDERAGYAEALQRNYEVGPPPTGRTFISARMRPRIPGKTGPRRGPITCTWSTVSVRPSGSGCGPTTWRAPSRRSRPKTCMRPTIPARLLPGAAESWIEMIMVLNELARSMGQPDFYPFVMSRPVVAKLQLVHMIVFDAADLPTAPSS